MSNKKSGMYGELPIIKIGKFEISMMSEDKDDAVWIKDTETDEGGEFHTQFLEPVIEEYFNNNF